MEFARRTWPAVAGLGFIAFLACLFAPAGRWWGMDLGATGANVFVLSLAALLVLMGARAERIFPEEWSLVERRAWLGAVTTGLIILAVAKYLWFLSSVDPVPGRVYELPGGKLLVTIAALVVAWQICTHLIARGAGTVEEDERDLGIRFAADRAGDLSLSLTMIVAVVLLAFVPSSFLQWWLQPLVLANVLIAVLISRSAVEYVALVALYARARA